MKTWALTLFIFTNIFYGMFAARALAMAAMTNGSESNSTITTETNLRPYQKLKKRLTPVAVAAHQGQLFGNGWMNTLAAFEQAYIDGADIVEFDLRITKDNVPIIYHDEELNTWTSCSGKVRDYTAHEIQTKCHFTFSNGLVGRNHYPPLFSEALAWSQGKMILDAEFKDFEVVEPALRIVQQYQAQAWTYFQTKADPLRYRKARKLDQEVVLLFNIRDYKDLQWALGLQDPALLIIELHNETRNKAWLKLIHDAGKLASENSWHFNSHYELFGASCDEVFNYGINIAVSNRPHGCVKQKQSFLRR